MPGRSPALHDLSKNADNHPVTAVTVAASQHATLQIQRKYRRLCGAILRPCRRHLSSIFYAATHGFLLQYFLDKATAEPILIRTKTLNTRTMHASGGRPEGSTIRPVVRNIILEDVYVGFDA
jgi:hypothetical protein